MGKDTVLDTADTATAVKRRPSDSGIKKASVFIQRSFFCLLASVLLSSCALPRIVILDDPLTPEEHINLGLAYEKKGETDSAIKEYKLAAGRLPLAYLYLGNLSQQLERPGEAEGYYLKAIDEAPDLADAYNNLAWLYYTKGEKLEEAEELALKAVGLRPDNANFQDTLKRIRERRSGNGI